MWTENFWCSSWFYFLIYFFIFFIFKGFTFFFSFIFIHWRLITLQYSSGFAIHWHEPAMDLHVFPIPFPPPASLPIPSLWVFPMHQPWALVSCIQPGLVICFTLDNIHVSMLFSHRFWFNWCGGVIWAPGILKSPQIFLMLKQKQSWEPLFQSLSYTFYIDLDCFSIWNKILCDSARGTRKEAQHY